MFALRHLHSPEWHNESEWLLVMMALQYYYYYLGECSAIRCFRDCVCVFRFQLFASLPKIVLRMYACYAIPKWAKRKKIAEINQNRKFCVNEIP